jgi:hypothetical protein
MALNGNFVSFQSIVEGVYRRAGYQTVDWAEAIEVIAETIRLIGVLPAYKDVTTNGVGSNPIPLEVLDFRTALPEGFVNLKAVRKVNLTEVDNGDGTTDLKISSFAPMIEASDIFYQSIREQWNDKIPSGTYDYTQLVQVETIILAGTSGTASITLAGGLTKTVTFSSDLETSASNFVTANAVEYATKDIALTSDGDNIIFSSSVAGTHFTQPIITNISGDLFGTVEESTNQIPVIVNGQPYKVNTEAHFEYKVNDGYIYTNFEKGYIEAVYTSFVLDEHGFPMIPDDERYINAVKWSLIEHIDYKKWRVSEITDKVYNHSERQRDWYIASAKNKANIPSLGEMEKLKNMFLRTIPNVNEYSNYFKYSNVQEQRYTLNGSRNNMRKY